MRLRLIRNATLELDYAGRRLLLDPMLDRAEARPPVANTPNHRRNPLVELPEAAGAIADKLAPVSGFVLRADGEPTVYLAGDTIWCDEVRDATDAHDPVVIVVNASGARFVEGDPIVMTAEDVVTTARHARGHVVAVHLEAINHCLETRDDLRARLDREGVDVSVPADGADVPAASRSTGR